MENSSAIRHQFDNRLILIIQTYIKYVTALVLEWLNNRYSPSSRDYALDSRLARQSLETESRTILFNHSRTRAVTSTSK